MVKLIGSDLYTRLEVKDPQLEEDSGEIVEYPNPFVLLRRSCKEILGSCLNSLAWRRAKKETHAPEMNASSSPGLSGITWEGIENYLPGMI